MTRSLPRSFIRRRHRMVEEQLEARGIADPAVLRAMRRVPREAFVSRYCVDYAYADIALPIEEGEVISRPYTVALVAELADLSPTDKILEIGTGSGYGSAVLAEMAGQIYSIERVEELARVAAERLRFTGYHQVEVVWGDGTLGLPNHAPYDAIVVSAEIPVVPAVLKRQLALGGRLILSSGEESELSFFRITRLMEEEWKEQQFEPLSFSPLITGG